MSFEKQLLEVAEDLYACLSASEGNVKLVLAESCTGGRAAAALVSVPGISEYFCGSAVVYRPQSKVQWLGVQTNLINEFTTESAEVTAALATNVLERTPEATVAAAITGHLEDDPSRERRQSHTFVAIAIRHGDTAQIVHQTSRGLKSANRVDRQDEASLHLCQSLLRVAIKPT